MTLRGFPFALLTLCLTPAIAGCVPAVVAGTVAGTVAGVSVVRQERSIGNALDDRRIQAALSARLINASTGLFLRVATNTIEGRVVLAGRVDSPDARIDATRIAWSIEGVRKVDNDIEVSESSGWLDGPSDIITRTQLAATLLGDKTIKDVNYTVDVVHGVIYVMGVAQNQAELERVLAHAESMRGKRRVENYAVLKTDPIRYGFGTPIAQQ
jgi:osmotically-inducible protein OsmY